MDLNGHTPLSDKKSFIPLKLIPKLHLCSYLLNVSICSKFHKNIDKRKLKLKNGLSDSARIIPLD